MSNDTHETWKEKVNKINMSIKFTLIEIKQIKVVSEGISLHYERT